ncbi:hypothetical protein [Bdellovibrio svalbardensis]|uniref:Uncharacterized protein n=1 Tax=Bdellovibrio svalbardensis TaxID=2972972 RepID=A0ABT6DNN6_9BACT|nr:hypothetical protein [Bdellovibrio svalbardensis]MDG0817715.1 hypothetical protein [Bdellovibrio svalbardensis]
MKRLVKLLLVFSLLPLSSMAASTEEVRQAVLMRQKALEMTRLQNLRVTDTYQRIFKICSVGLEYSKLAYVYESVKQTVNLGSFDTNEYNRIFANKLGISSMLAHDLRHDAFFVATNDCRLTQDQRDYFVMSLITLDLSGKLLGAVGVYGVFKASSAAYKTLRELSKTAFYALTSSGAVLAVFNFYQQLTGDAQNSEPTEEQAQSTKEQIQQHFDLNGLQSETLDIQQQVLQILNAERASLLEQLAQDPANEALKARMQKIDAKIALHAGR